MPMPHAHTNLEGQSLVEAAQVALADAGEQWTDMRTKVYAALCDMDRPVSAYDIAEEVSKREGRRVPPNSVYRILDVFVGANLVRRVESANAYVVNAHPACRHDCLFLICNSCGAVTHLDDDRLTRSFRSAAKYSGFEPGRSVMEMHGRCAECAVAKGN